MTKELSSETIARMPAELGEIVKLARRQSGLSQIEAAALCKVGTRFLSDLENGKPTVHLGKTMQVLRAFGLDLVVKKRSAMKTHA